MNASNHSVGGEPGWPVDKVNALRLGRRLVAEVPASRHGRRAFVTIIPVTGPADAEAQRQGWKRADRVRTFRLQHWEYDADRIDGFDHDIGAVLIREASAEGEAGLAAVLDSWELRPDRFVYPWETDDPT